MHAKVSSTGSRFFAHDGLNPTCPSLGETPEHRELKGKIAIALRELGCVAQLEATPSAADHGGWRADVLASSPHGTRVAFEVQLAGMTVDEGERRTAVYRRDGIQCVWMTPRNPQWFASLPACRLSDEGGQLIVVRGLGRLRSDERQCEWVPAGPVSFARIAAALLRGEVSTATQGWLYEVIDGNPSFAVDAVLLVASSEAAELNRLLQDQHRREVEHAANRAALYERQGRLLQVAINDAVELSLDQILLGVPPVAWDGALPVDRRLARGNDATGGGAAIWTVDPAGARELWAVASPVATKATPGLGVRWKRRGVRVYAETLREAGRIARAIGWKTDELVVTGPPGRDVVADR